MEMLEFVLIQLYTRHMKEEVLGLSLKDWSSPTQLWGSREILFNYYYWGFNSFDKNQLSECSILPLHISTEFSFLWVRNMLEGKALIEDTDMPLKMQIQAMASASQALDLYDVLDCKSVASHIKKVPSFSLSLSITRLRTHMKKALPSLYFSFCF